MAICRTGEAMEHHAFSPGALPVPFPCSESRISGPRRALTKFLAFDQVLDARATGPQWLIRPDVAGAVVDVLFAGQDKGFYELGSWVVMPNHVHLLLIPVVELPRVVSGIKVASAKAANGLLNRTGAFWSRDYFDRWIRSSDEEQRVIRYIESNPVKAGLCADVAEWRFSSAAGPRNAAGSRMSN